jgi:large subunit ribosomal protein L5e
MGFVKVVKSKPYFKRFQVKFRRRREGKTDYRARKRLIAQDKNKYNSPKYRFIVRITNADVICQFAEAKIAGDRILAHAYAHELPDYGIPVGLTNYAATYATGLLAARRLLKKLKLDDKYQGNTGNVGEDYNVDELSDGPRPFFALLDVGLRRTTTGSRIFAAMKGAVDGGIEIPHSERRFVGYDNEQKKLQPDVLRKHIFGGHVADYMNKIKAEDPQKFEKTFSQYVKKGIKPDALEALYQKAHKEIRANPDPRRKPKEKPKEIKKYNKKRLSLSQRKSRVQQRIANASKLAQRLSKEH